MGTDSRSQPRAVLELARAIAAARARAGLTQGDLANKISGSTRVAIAHIEQAERVPTPKTIEEIAECLKIPLQEWIAATHPRFRECMQFQDLLSELVGRE